MALAALFLTLGGPRRPWRRLFHDDEGVVGKFGKDENASARANAMTHRLAGAVGFLNGQGGRTLEQYKQLLFFEIPQALHF